MLFKDHFLVTQSRLILDLSSVAVRILIKSRSNIVKGLKGNFMCFQSLRDSSDSTCTDILILILKTEIWAHRHYFWILPRSQNKQQFFYQLVLIRRK